MKKITKTICLLLICLLLSSCVKYHANITINKDGSMDFSFINAIKIEYSDQMNSPEDYDKLKEEGFIVEDYQDNEYKGYKVSRHYLSIDDVASPDITSSKLTDNDDKMFNVKKGFFKNVYTAKLESNDTNEMKEGVSMYDEDNDIDINEALKSFDFKLNVTLPYGAISSNATSTSSDKKTLTWDLTNMKDQYVEFQFAVYNTNNIILVCGIALVVLMVLFFVFKYLKGANHRAYIKNNI